MDGIVDQDCREKILELETNLRWLIGGLTKEQRWAERRRVDPRVSPENVLEHTVKTALLAEFLLAMEMAIGNPHRLDPFTILRSALHHDFGEAINGDICLVAKTRADEEAEDAVFTAIIGRCVPLSLRSFFPPPLDRDDRADGIHRSFWQAIEWLGHTMFAYAEIARPDVDQNFRLLFYRGVCLERKPFLDELSKTFASVKAIWEILFADIQRLVGG